MALGLAPPASPFPTARWPHSSDSDSGSATAAAATAATTSVAPWSSPACAPPLWLVTMPTVARDGRPGTQSFAVRATVLQDAIIAAVACAGTEHALLHRRGARVDPLRASAELRS